MKKILFPLSVALVLTLAFSSCKKDGNTTAPIPKNEIPEASIPDGADYFFKAMQFYVMSSNTQGQSQEYYVGDAYAFFKDRADVGEVTLNAWPLKRADDGTYFYENLGNVPGGISFSSNDWAVWDATGDTAKGIAPIHLDDPTPFPANPVITDKKINTQESFFLIAADTIIADSTIFTISGPNATLRKVKGPNAKSCVFSKEEMATLGTGRSLGLIQISPYVTVRNDTSIAGSVIYFQKQKVVSKYVDLE